MKNTALLLLSYLTNDDIFKNSIDTDKLYLHFNNILEEEFAGYRFIEKIISPITNPTEIEALEESFTVTENFTSLKGCNKIGRAHV